MLPPGVGGNRAVKLSTAGLQQKLRREGNVASEVSEVVGVFRDLNQAWLAVDAARRRGMEVTDGDSLVQDTAGVHVSVRTGRSPEKARQLLLEYGAYSATITSRGQ
jgi:hypothetical protein